MIAKYCEFKFLMGISCPLPWNTHYRMEKLQDSRNAPESTRIMDRLSMRQAAARYCRLHSQKPSAALGLQCLAGDATVAIFIGICAVLTSDRGASLTNVSMARRDERNLRVSLGAPNTDNLDWGRFCRRLQAPRGWFHRLDG